MHELRECTSEMRAHGNTPAATNKHLFEGETNKFWGWGAVRGWTEMDRGELMGVSGV